MINPGSYYLRNPDIVVVGTSAHYLFIHSDGSVGELHTPHPAQWSHLMQLLMVPTRGDRLCQHLAGSLAIDTRDLLLFCHQGVILEAPTAVELETRWHQVFTDNQGYYCARGQPACAHLVVGLTGSILAGLMAPVIVSLCYAGFHRQIDLILTEPHCILPPGTFSKAMASAHGSTPLSAEMASTCRTSPWDNRLTASS